MLGEPVDLVQRRDPEPEHQQGCEHERERATGAAEHPGAESELDRARHPGRDVSAHPDLDPSALTCTRPRRPSTVPCEPRTPTATDPQPISHCAREAFRLPVTGSSIRLSPAEISAPHLDVALLSGG